MNQLPPGEYKEALTLKKRTNFGGARMISKFEKGWNPASAKNKKNEEAGEEKI